MNEGYVTVLGHGDGCGRGREVRDRAKRRWLLGLSLQRPLIGRGYSDSLN